MLRQLTSTWYGAVSSYQVCVRLQCDTAPLHCVTLKLYPLLSSPLQTNQEQNKVLFSPIVQTSLQSTIPPARPSFHSFGALFWHCFYVSDLLCCVPQSASQCDEGPPVVLSSQQVKMAGEFWIQLFTSCVAEQEPQPRYLYQSSECHSSHPHTSPSTGWLLLRLLLFPDDLG